MAACLALGAVVWCPRPTFAAPVDIEFTAIEGLTQVGIYDGAVGFTLLTRMINIGGNPIPWGFPVIETALNPWIQENDFPHQGHAHLDAVSQHPHARFYLYRQESADEPTVRIGQSDIKHAASVGNQHELPVNWTDIYSQADNSDQSFYGPVDEMDPITYELPAHEHFGGLYPALGPGYHRDHGTAPFSGDSTLEMAPDPGHPGADNIDHLIQAPFELMLPVDDARWWLAGEAFVVDDLNHHNNQRWIEIFPAAFGNILLFTTGETGEGLNTIPGVVPAPATICLFAAALMTVLGGRRGRTRSVQDRV